ncbi:MAG TPA: lytic transglycosylase domain-containing protein [Candidatus Binatia bacterium]|nr:lytic transglycosylase domain-containing protein [Candidatus Binatia bacterium]
MSYRTVLPALVLGAAVLSGAPGAEGASPYELTDADGVTHFTNAPTDPRYQRMPGFSGTAAGWLASPRLAGGGHREVIREVAERHGISVSLVESVIRVESGFNAGAVSPKGARGLMQLMPATAAMLGVRNAFDPRENIEGGVRHLRYLLERYPGNLPLVLAAYNAGEGAVSQYGGVPPYPETQQYVRKVMGHLGGAPPGATDTSRAVYRLVDREGTITFTNIPPAPRAKIR